MIAVIGIKKGDLMDRLKLSINLLENRWADLALITEKQEKTFYFERVPNDPIYDLLESAIKIFGRIDSTIIFHNGSQREWLSVKSTENGMCRFETEGARLTVPIKQFSRAILRMFDSYIFEFSLDDYNNQWGEFPKKDIEKLRNLCCSS